MRTLTAIWFGLVIAFLGGCASTPVEDDGRAIDPALLASYELYGQGERVLRPALARAASVSRNTKVDCSKQWELPFAVATAAGSEGEHRIAWKRALGVGDALTVIARTEESPLMLGERIVNVDGDSSSNPLTQLERLGDARETGHPFEVQLDSGKRQRIEPFEVCRGYTRLAPPATPKLQEYHWLMSLHPLELVQAAPTPDEMLWAVLWTQGLSEEGGARMKTYVYAVKVGGTLYQLVTLASGLRAAALAAEQAISLAREKATTALLDYARQQIIEQGKELALQRIRDSLRESAEQLTRNQAMAMLQSSAANRGALSGVGMVAQTVWERADAWAFARLRELGVDPLVSLDLHRKLVERQLAGNAFLLDAERLGALTQVAQAQGLLPALQARLRGQALDEGDFIVAAMPMASQREAFSFQRSDDPAAGRFARGLVEGLLQMPAQGSAR